MPNNAKEKIKSVAQNDVARPFIWGGCVFVGGVAFGGALYGLGFVIKNISTIIPSLSGLHLSHSAMYLIASASFWKILGLIVLSALIIGSVVSIFKATTKGIKTISKKIHQRKKEKEIKKGKGKEKNKELDCEEKSTKNYIRKKNIKQNTPANIDKRDYLCKSKDNNIDKNYIQNKKQKFNLKPSKNNNEYQKHRRSNHYLAKNIKPQITDSITNSIAIENKNKYYDNNNFISINRKN